jgi:ring-1,2-phenylacetyl-CoA epoxidase subunit PaaD
VVTELDVRAILATIDDPEMPISIVDLGIVEAVRVEPVPVEPVPAEAGPAATVQVVIVPTFVGCPALDMIRREIVLKVGRLAGVDRVEVQFVHDPPWTTDRISPGGRESLRRHGVDVPQHGGPGQRRPESVTLQTSAVACPFCGSSATALESSFGPTRCRLIMYCRSCGNPFERMKKVEGSDQATERLSD